MTVQPPLLGQGALLTEDKVYLIAPMIAAQRLFVQAVEGPLSLDVSGREGFIVLVLQANNTSLEIAASTLPHLFLFMVMQDGVGGFTWVPPPNVLWAGGTPGVAATLPGHADIYTLSSADGGIWRESGRAMDVG